MIFVFPVDFKLKILHVHCSVAGICTWSEDLITDKVSARLVLASSANGECRGKKSARSDLTHPLRQLGVDQQKAESYVSMEVSYGMTF